VNETVSETDKILNDIRAYLRISAAAASKSVAASVIDTQEKAQVYEKLGEGKSQQKIESETGIANQTISDWMRKFVEAGLVSPPNDYLKTYRSLFTLKELGINATALEKRREKQHLASVKGKKDSQEQPSTENKEGISTP
jgi:transposase-like protein